MQGAKRIMSLGFGLRDWVRVRNTLRPSLLFLIIDVFIFLISVRTTLVLRHINFLFVLFLISFLFSKNPLYSVTILVKYQALAICCPSNPDRLFYSFIFSLIKCRMPYWLFLDMTIFQNHGFYFRKKFPAI